MSRVDPEFSQKHMIQCQYSPKIGYQDQQHNVYPEFKQRPSLPPANEVWGKVISSQVSVCVCLSVHGNEVSLCLWSHVPFRGSLFGGLSPLYDKERVVRILLECILVYYIVAILAISNSFEILNMLTTIHSFSSKQ